MASWWKQILGPGIITSAIKQEEKEEEEKRAKKLAKELAALNPPDININEGTMDFSFLNLPDIDIKEGAGFKRDLHGSFQCCLCKGFFPKHEVVHSYSAFSHDIYCLDCKEENKDFIKKSEDEYKRFQEINKKFSDRPLRQVLIKEGPTMSGIDYKNFIENSRDWAKDLALDYKLEKLKRGW